MIVLAIDTAAGPCAACVYDAAKASELGRSVRDLGKGHAEHLMPVIEDALRQAGLSYGDLGRIGVAVGPGSFTGIRVGVAAARGLALACGVEAVGVSVLEALAAEAARLRLGRAVLAALDGGRGEVHAALYGVGGVGGVGGAEGADGADGAGGLDGTDGTGGADGVDGPNGMDGPSGAGGVLIVAPAAFDVEGASRLAAAHDAVVIGSAAPLIAAAGGGFDIVSADATADIAAYARLAAGKGPAGAPASPLYLRGADARTQAGFAVARR